MTDTHTAPWRDGSFPDRVPCHALMYPDEVAYLSWVGGQPRTRDGLIIDLGAYLGGSSYALARGSAVHGERAPHIIAYDSFRISKPRSIDRGEPLEHNESYADLYRLNLAAYLDRITMREGYVPEYLSHEQAADRVFPEQRPVDVLFVDCAKRWGVHNTIWNAFGPWLRDGSVVIQQDFRTVLLYLALHMYQLRNTITPAHSPDGGTVGFVASGPVPRRDLDSLWTAEQFLQMDFVRTITEVADWFDEHAPEPLSPWIWLTAAGDCADRKRPDKAIECFDIALSKLSRVASVIDDPQRWQLHRELWTGEVRRVAIFLRRSGCEQAAGLLERMSVIGSDAPETRFLETTMLIERWRDVTETCVANGYTDIVLYGAGRHTQKLIAAGFPEDDRVRLVAVVDDDPAKAGTTLRGVPVVTAEQLAQPFHAVIPSSDAHEDSMLGVCTELAEARDARVVPVYSGR